MAEHGLKRERSFSSSLRGLLLLLLLLLLFCGFIDVVGWEEEEKEANEKSSQRLEAPVVVTSAWIVVEEATAIFIP